MITSVEYDYMYAFLVHARNNNNNNNVYVNIVYKSYFFDDCRHSYSKTNRSEKKKSVKRNILFD